MDPPLPPVVWGNVVLGGKSCVLCPTQSEQFSDFHAAVHAEWKHSDKPNQGTVSKISSAQIRERDQSSHSSVYAQFSNMASGREIIPVGEATAALYDDTSMNGSNGPASPIVVEPGDREGLTEEMPERAFYMYAPQFHWILTMGAEDRPARSAIESIAHEQYQFGTQAEECHRRLIVGQVEAERRIIELEAQ